MRNNRKLRILLSAAALLVLLRFGGEALLSLAGLSWRRWVKSLLLFALLGTLCAGAAGAAKTLIDNPDRPDWLKWLSLLGAAVFLTAAAVYAGFRLFLTSNIDFVTEWRGQTVVVEYVGIFHERGYPYAGPFVRGRDVLFEWKD